MAGKNPENRKELRVSVRVTPQLKMRIQKAENITGLPETQVVIRSLEAYCDYVEKHGEITVPFVVLPKKAAHEATTRPISPPAFGETHEEWIARYPEPLKVAEGQTPYAAEKSPAAKAPPAGKPGAIPPVPRPRETG